MYKKYHFVERLAGVASYEKNQNAILVHSKILNPERMRIGQGSIKA
jgi:hypothetical protein